VLSFTKIERLLHMQVMCVYRDCQPESGNLKGTVDGGVVLLMESGSKSLLRLPH
jgi:hypothetical protein